MIPIFIHYSIVRGCIAPNSIYKNAGGDRSKTIGPVMEGNHMKGVKIYTNSSSDRNEQRDDDGML